MSFQPETNKKLTGTHLKLIAMVLMLIDHAAVIILENHYLKSTAEYIFTGQGTDYTSITYRSLSNLDIFFRILGRPSFFLFAYLLVEGFLHTSNLLKYSCRLFIFALISEIPFDYVLQGKSTDFTNQNIFFTLFLGLLAMIAMNQCKQRINNRILLSLATAASILVPGLLAYVLHSDYGIFGVATIGVFYLARYNIRNQILFVTLLIMLSVAFQLISPIEIFGITCFLPIYFYNGERGVFRCKYLFYLFYPLHLALLGLLATKL